ncbi:response regulator transcription factor [Endothiovibrio diazotrophicus]
MIRVAVVEDDADLLDEIAFNLRHEGMEVAALESAAALDRWLPLHRLEVLVLDLGLPDEDGLSVARRLRAAHPCVGIVILTGRSALADRLAGLEEGADHYLVKPVEMVELAATIRALARRLGESGEAESWVVDAPRLELVVPDGRRVSLTACECTLLRAAAGVAGKPVSRRALIEALGHDYLSFDERRLETQMSRLRRKLAPFAAEGFVVRGVKNRGYLFGVPLRVEGG